MLNRRAFLAGGVAVSALGTLLPGRVCAGGATANAFRPSPGEWRTFELTTRIALAEKSGKRQAWVPLPAIAEQEWSRPVGDSWTGTYTKADVVDGGKYGAKMLHLAWDETVTDPAVEIVSKVATRDRRIDLGKPGEPHALNKADFEAYTAPSKLLPTDGIVKATADKITAGAADDYAKARAIYEWIVDNTFRNPKTRGCGLGDIRFMLESKDLSGKCADLNALFVGLARASGLPARDLYGLRVAPSKFGYKSLGAGSATVTKAQHCRAEVYLSNWGWVPVDPADVRKVALEEPPKNLPMTDPKVVAARQTLFGAWEGNWIGLNDAHDVKLPGSGGEEVGFLMYPQAQTSNGILDCLDPASFEYSITAREIEV